MTDLGHKRCVPCEAGVRPLSRVEAEKQLEALSGWTLNEEATYISKTFEFKGFYKTMAFVNAVAWIAHQQSHHPDLEVSYNRCKVRYHTHAIEGLSENDFICAAQVEKMIFS